MTTGTTSSSRVEKVILAVVVVVVVRGRRVLWWSFSSPSHGSGVLVVPPSGIVCLGVVSFYLVVEEDFGVGPSELL